MIDYYYYQKHGKKIHFGRGMGVNKKIQLYWNVFEKEIKDVKEIKQMKKIKGVKDESMKSVKHVKDEPKVVKQESDDFEMK